MKLSAKQKELLAIIGVWLMIYASMPLYKYYSLLAIQLEFNWHELWITWRHTSAFAILFLLHHYVVVPKLVNRKHIAFYVVCVIVMLTAYTTFLTYLTPIPNRPPNHSHDNIERTEPPRKQRKLLTPPDMARVVMALLMMGVDLGAIAYFNAQQMKRRLLLLEQQNLKQELQHLRYQINPHFFMNTLNNIHVLVDVDKEKAKQTIIDLSKLMRFSLNADNKTLVPLNKEAEFLNLYISLMRLRYSDKLKIAFTIPEETSSDITLPPLMLATFVENAFKHGVSYLESSFILIKLWIDEECNQIHFHCVNSRHEATTDDKHHGIGLENVRKRLDLQYADNYMLDINQDDKTFTVNLTLPILKHNNPIV